MPNWYLKWNLLFSAIIWNGKILRIFLSWEKHPEKHGVFLETAHPVKFLDVVKDTLGIEPEVPKQIADILHKPKHAIPVSNYEGLKAFLMEN